MKTLIVDYFITFVSNNMMVVLIRTCYFRKSQFKKQRNKLKIIDSSINIVFFL